MSKPGDTVEDLVEDGVTPTPKMFKMNSNNGEGAMKGFTFTEGAKEVEMLMDVKDLKVLMEESEPSNRDVFIA